MTSDEWVLNMVKEGLMLAFLKHPSESGVRESNVHNLLKKKPMYFTRNRKFI